MALNEVPDPEPDSENTEGSGEVVPLPSDLVEGLPEEKVEQIQEFIHQQIFFAGPLPLPGILRGYEDVLPGGADRIFKMAEKSQNHEMAMEARRTDAGIVAQDKALTYAYRVVLAGLAGGIVLLALGRDLAALGAWAVALTTLIAPFLKREYDKRQAKKQLPASSDDED